MNEWKDVNKRNCEQYALWSNKPVMRAVVYDSLRGFLCSRCGGAQWDDVKIALENKKEACLSAGRWNMLFVTSVLLYETWQQQTSQSLLD